MPIPKHYSLWKRITCWLTWADLDEAVGDRELRWYKKLLRKIF